MAIMPLRQALHRLPNPETIYAEPSGDACDHYHRYSSDIALLAELDFNAYRFSIEWARIEPEEGEFSTAALDHYHRMLATCHEHDLDIQAAEGGEGQAAEFRQEGNIARANRYQFE